MPRDDECVVRATYTFQVLIVNAARLHNLERPWEGVQQPGKVRGTSKLECLCDKMGAPCESMAVPGYLAFHISIWALKIGLGCWMR